jgi:hypothetical protein
MVVMMVVESNRLEISSDRGLCFPSSLLYRTGYARVQSPKLRSDVLHLKYQMLTHRAAAFPHRKSIFYRALPRHRNRLSRNAILNCER